MTHTGAALSDTTLRWFTPSGDSGTVPLYRNPPGRRYTETILQTASTDSVHLSGFAGTLREANGGLPNCTPPRDTTWPTSTALLAHFEHIDRSVRMVLSGAENDTLYARAVIVGPRPGFSRDSIAKYLASIGARVSARTPMGRLILRIDRLRADFSSHEAFVDSLASSALFDFATPVFVSEGLRISIDGADGGVGVNSQGGKEVWSSVFGVWG